MNNKKIKDAVDKVLSDYRRAIIGLAHYDLQEKQKGCDCCYCNPEEPNNGGE